MESQIRLLASVRDHTGFITILRPFETIKKITLTDDTAGIVVETFSFDDRTRDIRFNKRGTKLIAYKRSDETGEWLRNGMVTMWDESFVPFIQAKFGTPVTPTEYAAKRQWERECYRPGTDAQPLDNAARTDAGQTTDTMRKYWA